MKTETTAGFTMVEVVLALSVAAFCLLAVLGLLPAGLNSNRAAIMQTEAASIARVIASDLRSTPSTSGTSSQFGFAIPSLNTTVGQSVFFAEGPVPLNMAPIAPSLSVLSGTAADTSALFRASVILTKPPAATPRMATTARILITWPALPDSDPTKPPTKYVGSYEVMTALDRN